MRKEKNPDGTLKYPTSISDGELLFNMGYDDGFAGGAYSCGRCHTTGWSYHDKTVDGNGALGPPLRGGTTLARFPGAILGQTNQADFVCTGSEQGKPTAATARAPAACPASAHVPAKVNDPLNTGEVGVDAQRGQRPRQGRRP